MNESETTHDQLEKDSVLQNSYDYTSVKPAFIHDPTSVRINNIVPCCPQGKDNSVITTSATEGKQEELRRFYQTYDPTVGLHTAAVLGGILVVLILYLFYKTKCKKAIKKGFNLACDRINGKTFEKLEQPKTPEMPNITRLMAKTGTWIRIDSPGVLPTMEVDALEATAQWVQNHPVEMQSLHDVTGIILRIDTDLIQAHDLQEKPYRTSRSDFHLSKGQKSDSLDSLRKTMLAQNHIGNESSSKYLAVPSGSTLCSNMTAQTSSSYPNITGLYYAQDFKTSDYVLPKRSLDPYSSRSHKIPIHICNSDNIQIHRTKSDILSATSSDSEMSDNSEMCEEPLLQHVIVETTGCKQQNQQYLWPANGSCDGDKFGVDYLEVHQVLTDLEPSDTNAGSAALQTTAENMQTRMETEL